MPYSLLCAVLYWVLMVRFYGLPVLNPSNADRPSLQVFPMGFGQGTAGVGGEFFQLLVIIFMEVFGVSIGQLIGALSPSMQIAPLFNPFIMLILSTFCGVTLPYPSMAPYWRWLYQLNPYSRTLSSMLSTELQYVSVVLCVKFRVVILKIVLSGLVIRCKADELIRFTPPSGQTCQQWAGEFVTAFRGYLENPNATDECAYCQYSRGEDFFEPLNIKYSNRWRDVWILFAFSGAFPFPVIPMSTG